MSLFSDKNRKSILRKASKIKRRLFVIGIGLIVFVIMYAAIYIKEFGFIKDEMGNLAGTRTGQSSDTLTGEQISQIYIDAAEAGTSIQMSEEAETQLMTRIVPLSDFMAGNSAMTPFGGPSDAQYKDIVLNLQATEDIHRPCTDSERYYIYQKYNTYASARTYQYAQTFAPTPSVPQTYAAARKDTVIINDGGGSGTKSSPTPTPRGGKVPTNTPAPRPSLTPTPKPTKAPTVTPTPKPTASPTPTPIPTVYIKVPGFGGFTMYEYDYNRAEQEIAKGIDETRTVTYNYTVPGGTIVDYLNNTYHIPWQALYNCTAFTSYISDEGDDAAEDAQISRSTFDDVCHFFSNFNVSYVFDYWKADLSDTVISIDNCNELLNGCFVEYTDENPVPFDPAEKDTVTIHSRKGLKPLVKIARVEEWALTHNYDTSLSMPLLNYYSFDIQEIMNNRQTKSNVSSCLQTYLGNYEYDYDMDISLFTYYGLEELPGAELALADFNYAYDMMGGTIGGFAFDPASLYWITGATVGEQIVLDAVNYIGYTYSNERRFEQGFADCSSLTYRVFKDLGYDISYSGSRDGSTTAAGECEGATARGQIISTVYDESILQPGDLLYWETLDRTHESYKRYKHVYHTGIYCGINADGDAVIIDASSAIGHIVCRTMWGQNKIVGIARIVP